MNAISDGYSIFENENGSVQLVKGQAPPPPKPISKTGQNSSAHAPTKPTKRKTKGYPSVKCPVCQQSYSFPKDISGLAGKWKLSLL
jgi:hypothetical protein